MLNRRTIPVLLAASVLLALSAPSASAVEIGNRCTTTGGNTNSTYIPTASNFIVPFDGIVTSWGTNFPSAGGPYPISLITVSGIAPNFTVTTISTGQSFAAGEFTYPARHKVKAGERFGTTGTPLTCAETGSNVDVVTSVVANGQAISTGPNLPNTTLATWIRVEVDADGDGFGDETQDLCPQSPVSQTTCPKPVLGAVRVPYSYGFRALVSTDFATTAKVTGSVKLPGKRRATTFSSKSVKTGPGLISKVTLKLPSSVSKALKSLSRSKKLKVTFTVAADGVLEDTTKKFSVSFPSTKR